MPTYADLESRQNALIRKATRGSVFIAPEDADPIAALTTRTAGPPEVINLTALPTDYADLGYLTEDGAQFSADVSTSDVRSWGSITPTRRDVTEKTTTLAVTAQETNIQTLSLYTGADLSGVTPPVSGEVGFSESLTPEIRYYRVFVLTVDGSAGNEVFIARFLPKASVTDIGDQSWSGGDDPITYPITLTAYEDSTLGYSSRWLFGGTGWKNSLTAMGFPAAASS